MSSERPPFILAYAADLQGCGMQRIALPIGSLVDAGVADARIDMTLWPVELALTAAPDTIVWQRQVEDSQIDAMEAYRKAMPDVLFVYELDDYLGEIPPASFHAGFMPPDLPKKIARGLAICDRVTTSTEPLAEWLRSLGGKDVRVVQNALPTARLVPRERPANAKLRVGFAGGISHEGDIEILRPAMAEIGNEVEWVFMGMRMKNPPVEVEFHEGVAPMAYLDALAALNIDLLLAPLEDNVFNKCKSNLRLLESASVGAAVIAQRYEPYLDGDPPVFAYADTPAEWAAAVKNFMAATPVHRKHSADKLRTWVAKHHTLEGRLRERLLAWSRDAEPWRPKQHVKCMEPVVLACATDPEDRAFRHAKREVTLVEACRRALTTGSDVLWMRPGTKLAPGAWDAMRLGLIEDTSFASVVPIATDGPNAFPKKEGWTLVSEAAAGVIAEALRTAFGNRLLSQPATSGPAILLSKSALSMGGIPDVDGCGGNEEVAILEWGLRLGVRGWRHCQAAGAFAYSAMPPAPPTQEIGQRFQTRGYVNNIRTPMEEVSGADRAAVECALLRKQWNGLRPGCGGFGADYASWSLLREALAEAGATAPVAVGYKHLSPAEFGWAALPAADWLVFGDGNVTLKANALAKLDAAIDAAAPEVDVIYADHETRVGEQLFPEFKACLDVEMLLARDYVTPICAVRSKLLRAAPADRSELYSVILREAIAFGRSHFAHIPEVLATLDGTAAPESTALNALQRQLAISELLGSKVHIVAHRQLTGALVVRRQWRSFEDERAPKVTIVIPTLGGGRLLQPCVNTILQHTAYENYEVLVVLNGSREEAELGAAARDKRVRVVRWQGEVFNWSEVNNWAVRQTEAAYYCFLNDDVCVASMERDWLDLMMGHAVLGDVGAVGARLIHPAGFLQHVGVVAHHGIAGHVHKGLPNGHPGSNGLAMLTHEASAVTGACMLVSKKNFEKIGGFDEAFGLNYSDTDFCLRLRDLGLRNVIEMGAELLHPEGTTRDSPTTPAGLARLHKDNLLFGTRWPDSDPYWSRNLALGVVQNGLGIQGLNCDVLFWEDQPASAHAQRVLIVNDAPGAASHALVEMRQGHVPYMADASGLSMCMTAPVPLNMGVWDIRKPAVIAAALKALGIDYVVVRSLIGQGGAAPPVELLRCVGAFGVPVEIIPTDHNAIAPWLEPDWDQASSPFGHVDVSSWRAALAEHWPYLATAEAAE